MKKLLFLLLFAAAGLQGWATDLYLVGDATPADWELSWLSPTKMTEVSTDVYEWTGVLFTGTGEGFKILTQADWNPAIHPSTGGLTIDTAGSDVAALPYSNGTDSKWTVSETAIYKITVTFRTSDVLVECEKVSDAIVDGYLQVSSADLLLNYTRKIVKGRINNNNACNIALTQDIDLSSCNPWTPIGTDGTKFTKTFDGQGHKIENMTVDGSKDQQGFFGVLGAGAVIKNLIIDSSCTISSSGGATLAAFAAVCNNSGEIKFENCGNEANVTGQKQNNAGFLGCNYGGSTTLVFNNCYNKGTISGGWENGAFSGWTGGGATFNNCYSIGEVNNGESGKSWARGSKTCYNCYQTVGDDGDITTISSDLLTSGELCYKLNGSVSGGTSWYQNLESNVDAFPVPFVSHSKVYANGNLNCDGSPKGSVSYSNTAGEVRDEHNYNNGFCTVCNAYQENALSATDGWYVISEPWQLRWMAESVTEHNSTYGSANIKLTADIDYTAYKDQAAMFGKPSNTFKGVFDGQCYTVTVAFVNNSAEETGLFRRINGGTVQNLKVDGTIETNQKLAGGICSGIWQKGKILNCESAVTITDNGSGDATHGGILACVHDRSNTDGGIQIINCLFSGTLNAPSRTGSGGIIGWPDNGATEVKVYNCLVSGTVTLANNDDNDVIVRNKADVQNTYYSCTLTNNLRNSKNGIEVPAGSAASGYLCYLLNEEVSGAEGWYQTLTGTPDAAPTPFYTSAKVYANGTFCCDGVTPQEGTTATYSNTEGSTIAEHSFTNHLCTGCKAVGQEPSTISGVYQIEDIGHLIWFAAYVNAGNATVSGKLTADINQSDAKYTPIGSSDHPYHGTFDGDYHTVTLNLTDGTKSNQGIFGVLTGGATINNLIAAGNVKGFNAVGGIAGSTHESGNVTFNNCGNEATVEATNANAGGILGVDMNSSAAITMKNVYSAGAINGVNDNGGLSGWAGNNPTIINSYCISEVQNGSQFCRCNGSSNTNTWGQDQITGTMLTDGTLCAKLGYAFRQNIGSGHPCFDQAQGFVTEIKDAGWSTQYITTSDVTIPSGIEAFAGVVNGSAITLVSISDAIAAGEPVVLKGAAGLYNFMPTTGATSAASNDLSGSNGSVTGGDGIYALAKKGEEGQEVVGFYPVAATVTIPAGKAYLEYTGSNGVKGFTFVFDDDATGIVSPLGETEEGAAIYNLAGQRINKMQKGINIVNGKKILF